ncbi:MAG: T9SS type A sorting domain-containing protein, partial [Bacteroidales bacterium]|nr:T9SS type A sorting domain-containing protein [Bacteroidales bacterium]
TTNAANCDSIVTLHLTVNYTTYGQETVTACDSFSWHSSTYTQSGDYPFVTTNAANCDSIVTLHLTVNYTTYGQETVTACDSFSWHGSTYTQSGDYPFVTTNAANCDSVVTLHLTIGFEILANISAAICEGEDYMVDGFSVINPPAGVGEYWDTIPRLGTCDSIVQLTLTVLPKPTMSSIIGDSVICKNQYATYYYDISDNNYRYLWLKDNLPWAENVSSVVLHETDSGTVFLTMQVEDQWNSCMASTSMLVQIQNSYAPDTTVIRRKGNSNILVCQPVTSEYGTVHYQWGYADRFIQEEVLMNGDYNYCQFDVGIDTSRYDYWVETYVDVPDGLSCANRTYYGRNTDVSVEDYDGNKIEAYFVQDRIVLSVNAANPNDIGAGLYDVNGRLLLSKEYGRTDNVQDAVSVRVAAGVYFLKVNIGGQMYSVKLLKF